MHLVIPCPSVEAVHDAINGTVNLGPLESLVPIGGLTLIFTVPAVTVTFAGALGDRLSPQQIAAAIKASDAAFNPFSIATRALPNQQPKTKIAVQNDAGFTINSTGTANALLGLSTTSTTVSGGMLAFAKIIISEGSHEGHYLVVVDGT